VPGVPETWDKEADVVVVGYGGAGAATAITAADEGATVLLLEKQAEDSHT
jgi:succinate dehydrogenase/fumarate reductase flavoprotein subunit